MVRSLLRLTLTLFAVAVIAGPARAADTAAEKSGNAMERKGNAEEKAADMNTDDVESIKKMVAGTARSMGVEVEG